MPEAIDRGRELSSFGGRLAPREVAEFAGRDMNAVKVEGELVCHAHPDTGGPFLPLRSGIGMLGRFAALGERQMFPVSEAVEHQPVARRETRLLLIKPTGIPNGGARRAAAPTRHD